MEQQPATARRAEDIEAVEKLGKARDILLRNPQGHHRPGRSHRAPARLPLRPRPLPDGGRARPGQDAAGRRPSPSVLELQFRRIQFTPDLMPSDITGTEILEEDHATGKRSFRFVHGPSSPTSCWPTRSTARRPRRRRPCSRPCRSTRSRSRGTIYDLDPPFFVLATQNPIEQEGTYPLPEAQLDRFMFCVYIDYPSREEERGIVKATTYDIEHELQTVLRGSDILAIQRIVRRVPVSDHVVDYAVNLVRATRPEGSELPQFVKDWLSWAPAREPASTSSSEPRPAPSSTAATTSPATTCAPWPCPSCATASSRTSTPMPRASTRWTSSTSCSKIVPEPAEADYAKKPAAAPVAKEAPAKA